MGYPQDFIDKVIESSNVVDIISQYTQLKPSGRGHMGRCPFPDHQEKTASFSVSEAKQVYHCFGCKKSGNVITFLRDYNGMNFPEALEYLADRAGVPVPEMTKDVSADQTMQAHQYKKNLLKANKLASDFFREVFKREPLDHPVRQYVLKRKLNPETLEEFQIGYAPQDWEALGQYLLRNRISMDIAEEAKLVKARNEGNGYFDLFRDRLMFPIQSASGEVLAFGGRILEQGEPKYLNSPESPVFHKGKVLYGLAQTAKYIRSEDMVLVVEGYMDLVSLFQAGLKNVVATMGTALTADHAKLIKRLTANVVVLFDGDDAGRMAAERSLPVLLSQGLYPRGLTLTEVKDPDEFVIKFGTQAMTEKIQQSPDLFKVIVKSWMADYRGEPSDKVKLVDKIRPVFDVMLDARLKSLYADELCQLMGVTKTWLRDAFKTNAGGRVSAYNTINEGVVTSPTRKDISTESVVLGVENEKIVISDAPKVELMLLQATLKSRANFEMIDTLNDPIDFKQLLSQIKHLGIKQIFENAHQAYRQDITKFDKLVSLLIDKIDKPEFLFQTSKLDVAQNIAQMSEFDEEKERKLIYDLVHRIQQDFLKDQARKLAFDLKQQGGASGLGDAESQNDRDEMLRQFAELQKSRLSLKNK
ncbi:MAG: DNA primase [Pseudobdellovibrio sp.]